MVREASRSGTSGWRAPLLGVLAAFGCGRFGYDGSSLHGVGADGGGVVATYSDCLVGPCVPLCDEFGLGCDVVPSDGSGLLDGGRVSDASDGDAGVTASCVRGECGSSCASGWADCDGNPGNGCEAELASDAAHCGSCTTPCEAPGEICSAGVCETPSCPAGFDDCDELASTGCEAELATSVQHCGGCNQPCTNANGSTSCSGSACLPACSPGFDDCDGSPQNGCETELATSVQHCGGCGNACPSNGGTAVCSAGSCDTVCDLSGTFALGLSAAASWRATSVLLAGSGTLRFWLKAELVHTGTSVDVTVTECGRTLPDYSSVASERLASSYPNALFDGGLLPSSTLTVTLSDSSPDASVTWPQTTTQMGINLANPATDAWPGAASSIPAGQRVDVEGDGKPGATTTYATGGGYSYPRTSSSVFGFNRADLRYEATRLAFSLAGALSSCSSSSGSATVSKFDASAYGCRRSGGSQDCDATEASFVDANERVFSIGAASYVLQRVALGADCAAIRAAVP